MIKKIFCIIVICTVIIIPFSVSADDDVSSVVVWQSMTYGSSYHVYQQSPVYYGSLASSGTLWPINFTLVPASISAGTYSPQTVTVDVTDQKISHGNCTVYLGLYNCYTKFKGSTDTSTLFTWDSSIPGYTYRGGVSSTMGFAGSSGLTTNAPSSNTVGATRLSAGATGGANLGFATVVATRTPNQHYVTYESSNASSSPEWAVASSSYVIYKTTIGAASDVSNTVRFTWDSGDLCSCTASSSASGSYLMHGVFVPIAIAIDTTNYSDSMLGKLDTIITSLGSIAASTAQIDLDLDTIIGYLNDGDYSVIDALSDILLQVTAISGKLNHYGGINAPANGSAIQYIEWYLRQVLSNTNSMVTYLDNITSTLSSIADVLDASTEKAQDTSDDIEEAHDIEADVYDDASHAIGELVIQDFSFNSSERSGIASIGRDFVDLWNALDAWTIVYSISMLLGVALLAIRHNPARSKKKGKG